MAKFLVVSSNPSNEGKTFVWKLTVTTNVKVFGIVKSVKRTFYIGGMPVNPLEGKTPEELETGVVFEEDLRKFEIVERDSSHLDDDGNVIMIKWLHAKVA